MKSILLISLLALTACSMDADESSVAGWNREAQAIIGGEKATAGSPISRATVYIHLPSGTFCSGALLNDYVVLTAAHCVKRFQSPTGFMVFIPNADKSCSSTTITKIAVAPKLSFMHSEAPDLALLKLERALCSPPLAKLSNAPNSNEILFAAGFGAGTTYGLPDYFSLKVLDADKDEMKDIFLKDSSDEKLALEAWENLEPYYDEYLETSIFALAINPQQGLCSGDSGGPVYQVENGALKVFGVNTGGIPHPTKGLISCMRSYLQILTPVGPSISWIESVLESW